MGSGMPSSSAGSSTGRRQSCRLWSCGRGAGRTWCLLSGDKGLRSRHGVGGVGYGVKTGQGQFSEALFGPSQRLVVAGAGLVGDRAGHGFLVSGSKAAVCGLVCAGLRHASELGFEAVSLSEALGGDPVVDIFDEDLSIFDAIGQGCVSVSRVKVFDEGDLKP